MKKNEDIDIVKDIWQAPPEEKLMDRSQAYEILKEIVHSLAIRGENLPDFPKEPLTGMSLEQYGIDLIAFSEILDDLRQRFGGKELHLDGFLVPHEYHLLTMDTVLQRITNAFRPPTTNPEVIYVDDEEENLFVFKRRFGKDLNLRTFTNPVEALEHIRNHPDVSLVITDEVMPRLSGNELCDEVRKTKPNMKFILITGNPNQDDDLMYRSLRQSRFYEFINKPMDLGKKGDEYLSMIRSLLR